MSLSSDKHDVDMTDLGDEDIVFLETSDRLIFTVSAKAANQSDVIKDMLEGGICEVVVKRVCRWSDALNSG